MRLIYGGVADTAEAKEPDEIANQGVFLRLGEAV
jgi:hypothetical protein